MFTFLLVSFEISILFLFYWAVFVREPGPYKVDNDVWGTYAGRQLRKGEEATLLFSDKYPGGWKRDNSKRAS
ncbi:MAG: hypothetical protein K2X81_13150 [Candidatus Obscuribacterales bacterium]|nr:hypothetical protein [Candidatus Obscuribacterales bacterium]